jgi:hypothetical protein
MGLGTTGTNWDQEENTGAIPFMGPTFKTITTMTNEEHITNICTLASGLLASTHYTETTAAGDPLPKLHHSGDQAVTHSAIRLYEDIREKWQAHLNQKLEAPGD